MLVLLTCHCMRWPVNDQIGWTVQQTSYASKPGVPRRPALPPQFFLERGPNIDCATHFLSGCPLLSRLVQSPPQPATDSHSVTTALMHPVETIIHRRSSNRRSPTNAISITSNILTLGQQYCCYCFCLVVPVAYCLLFCTCLGKLMMMMIAEIKIIPRYMIDTNNVTTRNR